MDVEVLGTAMAQKPNEDVKEQENEKLDQDVKEAIKFDSLGETQANEEENCTSDISFPKDAIDEWPVFKRTRTFSFIRHSRYDDPKLKVKIDQANKEVQKCTQAREKLFEELKAKNSEKAELISQLKSLNVDLEQFNSILGERRKEMEPLRHALSQLRNTSSAGGRGVLCSSEEELNDLIHSLQYRIQHESIPLAEEKQLIKEIRHLEGTRAKVIANAAVRAGIQESMGPKEALQDQVKLMGVDLDGLRREHQAVWTKLTELREKRKTLDDKIESLREEVKVMTQKRDKAYESIRELRRQNDEGNALYIQNRNILSKAKELAAMKDVVSVKELSNTEVERFMSLWCSSKTFRDDYEKRLLPSLDRRLFSRDGRLRNPEEKPILASEAAMPSETEKMVKSSPKESKEAKSSPKDAGLKVQKATSDNLINSKSSTEQSEETGSKIPVSIGSKPDLAVQQEVDVAKLKEMKREEEMAKAKQAMERKRKLAEKAAAKAALKAQKEAEKKIKEREKKAQKKATASSLGDNHEEQNEPLSEPEKVDVDSEVSASDAVQVKEKFQKDKPVRHRNRVKGTESLPRAILKRKKPNQDWLWAAAAALVVLMLMVILYFYIF